jgi:hypothetical protein
MFFPSVGIGIDVISDSKEFSLITDDMVIIIGLPDAGHSSFMPGAAGNCRLEPGYER